MNPAQLTARPSPSSFMELHVHLLIVVVARPNQTLPCHYIWTMKLQIEWVVVAER